MNHRSKPFAFAIEILSALGLLMGLCIVQSSSSVFPQTPSSVKSSKSVKTVKLVSLMQNRNRLLSMEQNKKGRAHAFENEVARLDWFLYQRTFPHPFFNLPPLARSNALSFLKQLETLHNPNLLQPLVLNSPQWIPIGPLPINSSIGSI